MPRVTAAKRRAFAASAAAPSSPARPMPSLMLVLSMQPELLLDALVAHPTAIVRLALTCRLAYKTCMNAARTWRDVCVRHRVYVPSVWRCGARLVTADMDLTRTYHWALWRASA